VLSVGSILREKNLIGLHQGRFKRHDLEEISRWQTILSGSSLARGCYNDNLTREKETSQSQPNTQEMIITGSLPCIAFHGRKKKHKE